MTDPHLSLWLDDEPAAATLSLAAATRPAGRPGLSVEFLDANDETVGTPVRARIVKPIKTEVPSGDGGFAWTRVQPPLSLSVAPPDEAASLRVFSRGLMVAHELVSAVRSDAPGPPAARRSSNPAGNWKLVLVSEKFADAATFFAAYEQLRDFVLDRPPFNEPATAARFQIEALFWPSGTGGLFNTKVDGRLVHGDNALARRYVDASGSTGRLTMVLVNLDVRGGAGGTSDRPAWVTTKSEAGEQWPAVALHELGHSFGLADEYSDSSQTTPEPSPLEPNVTKERNAANAPWASLRTPGIPHDPTNNAAGEPAVGPETIGTFEGARYKRRLRYRPTAQCLMRSTGILQLCPICQNHVRRVLSQ